VGQDSRGEKGGDVIIITPAAVQFAHAAMLRTPAGLASFEVGPLLRADLGVFLVGRVERIPYIGFGICQALVYREVYRGGSYLV
jgi:hypothetical protein